MQSRMYGVFVGTQSVIECSCVTLLVATTDVEICPSDLLVFVG